jgi:hypothetical protein
MQQCQVLKQWLPSLGCQCLAFDEHHERTPAMRIDIRRRITKPIGEGETRVQGPLQLQEERDTDYIRGNEKAGPVFSDPALRARPMLGDALAEEALEHEEEHDRQQRPGR